MIRRAEAADAGAIAAIWNHDIRDGVSTFNSVEKEAAEIVELIAAQPVWVADKGGVIGFATYGAFRGGIGYAQTREHSIYLAKAARGQGAGRALMAALEAHARAEGIHAMMAGIGGENAAGIGFHGAIGYRHVATLPEVGRKFDRWMDLVLMQKIL